ncbi:uncharacterized protein LOC107370410 [Tetranychus urticae]|uniref:Chitin-binding type-2 domain-containing protein n=1 Tax=Tetranychus urticae TaxID=32264 RepID=T1L5A2_TETUR|nr:uncharacterized protein LOC107370410 [Tetranychus urticae]
MHWIILLTSLPFILVNSQSASNEQSSLEILCQPICLNSMNSRSSPGLPISSHQDPPSVTSNDKQEATIKDKPLEKLIVVTDNGKDGKSGEAIERKENGLNGEEKMLIRKSSESASRENQWNSSRWAKLPIRPPKLRFGSKPVATKARRIAYGSMVKTRSLSKEDSNLIPIAYTNSSQTTSHDILELSSSEKRTSRMRIGRRHNPQANDHFESEPDELAKSSSIVRIRNDLIPSSSPSLFRFSTSGDTRSSSYRNIPKLLLPKFSRPAMYSLNGFIPKPNIQRLTTSTSTTVKPSLINRLNRKDFARSNNLDKNNQKKHETKHRQSLEDSDNLKTSGSVNRLSKRRGYLSTSKQRSTLPNADSKYKLANRRGQPGKDYPMINSIPKTSFDCKDHIGGSGFYADPETGCQVWHMCQGHRKHSFLCPNGTIFNQKSGVCDWWYNVDCVESPLTLLGTSETTFRTSRSNSMSLFDTLLMERRLAYQ